MKFENGVELLNNLRLLFYSLMGISLMFFAFLLIQESQQEPMRFVHLSTSKLTRGIAFFTPIALMILTYIRYYRQLNNLSKESMSLRERLSAYFRINRTKYIILVFTCFLALGAYVLTVEPIFKGIYLLLLIGMGMSNPGLYTILKEIRANKEDIVIMKKNLPIP